MCNVTHCPTDIPETLDLARFSTWIAKESVQKDVWGSRNARILGSSM